MNSLDVFEPFIALKKLLEADHKIIKSGGSIQLQDFHIGVSLISGSL